MGLIKAEFAKIYRAGWTYAVIIGMNSFSIVLFGIFMLLFLKSTAIDDAARLSSDYAMQAMPFVYFIYMLESGVFSFLSFFLMAIYIGLIIGREFENGSIELFILSPYRRVQIFLAKIFSIFIVYFAALLVNVIIRGIVVMIINSVHPSFSEFLQSDVLLQIFAVTVLTDLSWIAFVMLIGMLSNGVATTVIYSLIGYFSLVVVDIVFVLGKHYEFLTKWQLKFADYTFTASGNVLIIEELPKYVFGQISELPVSFELLSVNLLYGLLFFLLAGICFNYREVR